MMTDSTGNRVQELERLKSQVDDLLKEARRQGATQAEAGVSSSTGLSVNVRLGEIETVERNRDRALGLTLYFGQHKGSASTTDMSPDAMRETVSKACTIAKQTSEDKCTGLADAHLMAQDIPDLDLHHPWNIDVDQAARLALECETAARDTDKRITNSEGSTLSTQSGGFVYGNSHGFIGGYPTSRHTLSCSVIAQEGDSMQRDYWYSTSRSADTLDAPEAIGKEAAKRSLSRLNGRKISTQQAPVLFRSDIAPSLLRGLTGAIRGHALYRKASFLLDQLEQGIFPEWVHIHEQPRLVRALASAPFDDEGVATRAKDLVRDGILQTYLLDSYSARKLDMQTTGNAGGVRNLQIDSSGQSFDDLLQQMNRGLVVTELMGQGVNTVTGDYSRGVAGFWVEDGEIQFPVEEITVAGNLKTMFQQLLAVGTDNLTPGSIKTGSWLIESMTIAGD